MMDRWIDGWINIIYINNIYVKRYKYIFVCRFLSKSKSFCESGDEVGEASTALEVVRNKRAKLQLAETKVQSYLLYLSLNHYS